MKCTHFKIKDRDYTKASKIRSATFGTNTYVTDYYQWTCEVCGQEFLEKVKPPIEIIDEENRINT